MGKRSRKKTLPQGEWCCIWCDRSTGPFNRREHVIQESLGGTEVLPRGAVCDVCNSHGLLKRIDDQLSLHPVALIAKFDMGAHGKRGPLKEFKHGFRRGPADGQLQIDGAQLQDQDTVEFLGPAGGPGTIRATLAGPSRKVGNEHLTRGFHKVAYNAIAFEYGVKIARSDFGWLRDLVRDFEVVRTRPILVTATFDQSQLRSSPSLGSRFSFATGAGGEPRTLTIDLRAMRFVVSVTPSLRPLRERAHVEPDLVAVCGRL